MKAGMDWSRSTVVTAYYITLFCHHLCHPAIALTSMPTGCRDEVKNVRLRGEGWVISNTKSLDSWVTWKNIENPQCFFLTYPKQSTSLNPETKIDGHCFDVEWWQRLLTTNRSKDDDVNDWEPVLVEFEKLGCAISCQYQATSYNLLERNRTGTKFYTAAGSSTHDTGVACDPHNSLPFAHHTSDNDWSKYMWRNLVSESKGRILRTKLSSQSSFHPFQQITSSKSFQANLSNFTIIISSQSHMESLHWTTVTNSLSQIIAVKSLPDLTGSWVVWCSEFPGLKVELQQKIIAKPQLGTDKGWM